MHLCMDEVLAAAALLPWVGAAVAWVRTKWRDRWANKN